MISRKAKGVSESATVAINSRANELIRSGVNVIKLGIGEPDFNTPENINQAAKKAIDQNFSKYTNTDGIPELKSALVKKFKRDNNIDYSEKEVAAGTGAKQILYNVFLALLNPGDEVITPSPYWLSYPDMVRVADGVPVFSETEDFAITANLIEQKITDRTKLIIINSPNNPTGSVISKSELEKIADLAVEKNIFVISDECYEFFIYDEKHYSIASLGEKVKELTLTVNALSKTYAMPGWRLGYAGGPEKIIKTMASLQSHLTGNPNSITQKAAVEALLGDQSSIKEMTREFRNRRDLMTKRLNEISGIKCIKPKGAFYCFPDVSQLYNGKIKSSSDFSLYLLDRAHVATVPGIVFGSDKHIRLSFASPMKDIEEGMDRIEKAVRII